MVAISDEDSESNSASDRAKESESECTKFADVTFFFLEFPVKLSLDC